MGLIRQVVKNLISGISQQPQILRYPEQLHEQKNGLSNGPQGLQKRPPGVLRGSFVLNTLGKEPFSHGIHRDASERYHVLMDGKSIVVRERNGVARQVNYQGSALEYIKTDNPRRDLRAVTIADYTFILNTKKVVRMAPDQTPNQWDAQGALINVKSGQYGRWYQIIVDGVVVSKYQTGLGNDPEHVKTIDTNYIVSRLHEGLVASGFRVREVSEGWLNFDRGPGGAPIYSLATRDGFNNLAMFGFINATQKFNNLPQTAPHGYTVMVKGSNDNNSDDYYVAYNAVKGVWEETARPAILTTYDKSTMPHVLVREADGTFTCRPAEWDKRTIGDNDSNPIASFVNKPISAVFFVRNRLGLLAGENVILSKAGEFFKFWMSTATDVLDSDMIDLAVPDESVATLTHAITFNEELLVFSANAQFVGRSDTVFSPKAFRLDKTTSFDSLPTCQPLNVGRRVYFAAERAKESSLMEYYIVEDVSAVKDAIDITSHVPSLIPNSVYKILGKTSENILILLTSGATNRMYVYKYLWQQEQRVQASWSYWEFNADIVSAVFFGETLSVMFDRGNGLYTMEEFDFTVNQLDIPRIEPYRAMLDRKTTYVVPMGTYDEITNTTTFDLANAYGGQPIKPGSIYGILNREGYYREVPITSSSTVTLNGDYQGQEFVVGETYHFMAQLSELMVKNDDGKGGIKAESAGVLQVRRIWINYSNSSVFDVNVGAKGKRSFSYRMTARTLGDSANIIGSLPFASGSFDVPIQSDSRDAIITIESTGPGNISLIGYGFEGNFLQRGGRH